MTVHDELECTVISKERRELLRHYWMLGSVFKIENLDFRKTKSFYPLLHDLYLYSWGARSPIFLKFTGKMILSGVQEIIRIWSQRLMKTISNLSV